MKRRGFTTVELMVAIAIIVVLVSIVFYGTSRMASSSKISATRVDLQNLQSLLAEYETARGSLSEFATSTYLDNPGDVTADAYKGGSDIGRWKSQAVANTQIAIRRLATVPKNRNHINDYPHKMSEEKVGPAYAPTPIIVKTVNPPGYGEPNPMIPADAWGNPIIFVPGNGMLAAGTFSGNPRPYKVGVVMTDGTDQFRSLKNGATESQKNDGKSWEVLPRGINQVVTMPGHRPFFASAGPDGDFRATGDNVYSLMDD